MFFLALILCSAAFAEDSALDGNHSLLEVPIAAPALPDAPSSVQTQQVQPEVASENQLSVPPFSDSFIASPEPLVISGAPKLEKFQYRQAIKESAVLLSFQHGLRLFQGKTREQLGGPFFRDWGRSIQGVHGWGDGDNVFTNYVLHPGMGGISNFIYLQNSPARDVAPDFHSGKYWRSRLKGMAFATIYSTQFEIGPYSEATIGNVGLRPGTSGYVDFVMTPIGGFAFTVIEDWADTRIARHEERGLSPAKTRLLRSLLNPERSIANLLRRKAPWYRDTR